MILFNSECLFQNQNRRHNPQNSLNEYFVFAFCAKQLIEIYLSKYLDTISIPVFQKPLANESCKNFGVFLFHATRQTHPQLTGTIPERKLNLVNNLMSVMKKRKKLVKKSKMKQILPTALTPNAKMATNLNILFFKLKRALLTMLSR